MDKTSLNDCWWNLADSISQPEQNGQQFAYIFKCIFLTGMSVFLVKFCSIKSAYLLNSSSMSRHICSMVGVTKPISFVSLHSPFFQNHQSTRHLLNVTFIFDRCHHSTAVVAPVKYESDSENLTGTFARHKIYLMEKFMNRALVTPTPGLCIWTQNEKYMNEWPNQAIIRYISFQIT